MGVLAAGAGGWMPVEEEVVDRSPNDPVSGYVHFFADVGSIPLSLVVSESPMESFRAVFPEPDNDAAAWPGFDHISMEEHFGGELSLILAHPDTDDFRICFRILNPEEDLNRNLEQILTEMIRPFTFSEER